MYTRVKLRNSSLYKEWCGANLARMGLAVSVREDKTRSRILLCARDHDYPLSNFVLSRDTCTFFRYPPPPPSPFFKPYLSHSSLQCLSYRDRHRRLIETIWTGRIFFSTPCVDDVHHDEITASGAMNPPTALLFLLRIWFSKIDLIPSRDSFTTWKSKLNIKIASESSY